jgi:hypothetical protein
MISFCPNGAKQIWEGDLRLDPGTESMNGMIRNSRHLSRPFGAMRDGST